MFKNQAKLFFLQYLLILICITVLQKDIIRIIRKKLVKVFQIKEYNPRFHRSIRLKEPKFSQKMFKNLS